MIRNRAIAPTLLRTKPDCISISEQASIRVDGTSTQTTHPIRIIPIDQGRAAIRPILDPAAGMI
ncbi:MAG: hypothetical protein NTW32_02405 [Chloroflexi bacterium]|nr:hypothetical protein [Chloroflexota bacterium]